MPNTSHRRAKERAEIILGGGKVKNLPKFDFNTLTYTYKKLREYQVACLKTKIKRNI